MRGGWLLGEKRKTRSPLKDLPVRQAGQSLLEERETDAVRDVKHCFEGLPLRLERRKGAFGGILTDVPGVNFGGKCLVWESYRRGPSPTRYLDALGMPHSTPQPQPYNSNFAQKSAF